jgi:hypothetical protein
VLSESSLFVYPHAVLIKTCGVTPLLASLAVLAACALQHCAAVPQLVQYSRSSYLFAKTQPAPHQSFEQECAFLNKALGCTGTACVLGPTQTRSRRWHVYSAALASGVRRGPVTLEVVMTRLKPCAMKPYYHPQQTDYVEHLEAKTKKEQDDDGNCSNDDAKSTGTTADEKKNPNAIVAASSKPLVSSSSLPSSFLSTAADDVVSDKVTRLAGIDAIVPGATIVAHQFQPFGYSCNAIDARDMFTIHITPQPECSFASFEWNCTDTSRYAATVTDVVRRFQPGHVSVCNFNAAAAAAAPASSGGTTIVRSVNGELAKLGFALKHEAREHGHHAVHFEHKAPSQFPEPSLVCKFD